MPHKPLHPCKHPGCAALVQAGQSYCDAHMPQHKNDHARRHPEHQRLYNNSRWRAYRRMFLSAHPLCVNFDECHNEATVVDHIEDHMGDYDTFWNPANHQPMCAQCHNTKTARTRGWGKGG